MERQRITLSQWDWDCIVFYDADEDTMPEVLQTIREMGGSRWHLFKAKAALSTHKPNTGLTFSIFDTRESVMVIGYTSSAEEFQNTLDHEKGHLARHICLADDIDPYGEEAQYLAGMIGQQMYPVAKKYLCDCG